MNKVSNANTPRMPPKTTKMTLISKNAHTTATVHPKTAEPKLDVEENICGKISAPKAATGMNFRKASRYLESFLFLKNNMGTNLGMYVTKAIATTINMFLSIFLFPFHKKHSSRTCSHQGR